MLPNLNPFSNVDNSVEDRSGATIPSPIVEDGNGTNTPNPIVEDGNGTNTPNPIVEDGNTTNTPNPMEGGGIFFLCGAKEVKMQSAKVTAVGRTFVAASHMVQALVDAGVQPQGQGAANIHMLEDAVGVDLSYATVDVVGQNMYGQRLPANAPVLLAAAPPAYSGRSTNPFH